MGSLFDGTPQTATSYVSQTSEMPKWLQDAIYNQIQVATNLANKPYQAYTGELVAPLSAQQQQAYQNVSANQGAWQPGMNAATTGTQNLANATAVGNINAYMNPYTQNVTDQIAKLGARNLSENLLPAVGDQFVRAGQFGGSRMGDFGQRAVRDTQESILGQQTQALQQGYGQALGASQSDLARQQGALSQLGQLTQQGQQLRTSDTAALEAAGLAQQQAQQAQDSANYNQYLTAQQYPAQQLSYLNSSIRGLQFPTTSTTTTQDSGKTYSASPLAQLASVLSTGAGLYNMKP
jgi:hypothetical protein